ncbi:MAG: porin family protein [Candidatus Zixiibacteriota bacterium]
MKKTIVIMGILVLLATGAFSMEITGAGAKVGLNMASVNEDEIDILVGYGFDTKSRMGFTGGAFVEYAFVPQFSMQVEGLLSMKGTKLENEAGDEYTLKLSYLEFPVLLKLNIPMEGKLNPHVYAGPFLGILLSAKGPFPNSENEAVIDEDVDIKDYMNTVDYGMVLGMGLEYQLSKGSITFDARFNLGMSKIGDSEKLDMESDPNWKNKTISFMFGYNFF